MSTQKRTRASILLLLILCLSLVALSSCGSDMPPIVTDYGIDGTYYMVDNDTEYQCTISGNQFMLTGFNGEEGGVFTYAENALTMTFVKQGATTASATLADDVMNLTYNGNSYRLLKKVSYTVSFDAAGASVAAQSVINGMHATKPADPAKDGYAFLGWYTDETHTTAFDFGATAITGNVTVYAWFEELVAETEYTVTLDCEGESYAPIKTVNGVAYKLPVPAKAGSTFVGWWVSDYQSADRPTYRYEGQVLTEDTTLFALFGTTALPYVSVVDDTIKWDESGINPSYRVVVMKDGQVIDQVAAGSSSDISTNFSALEPGDYVITVTLNNNTATAYYKNKALDRASNIRVVASDVLVFDPIPNAQEYFITVVCGNANHAHTMKSNGLSTVYTFSTCEMCKEGIRFVITACAEDYATSTSDEFTYYRALDPVTDVTIQKDVIKWGAVKDALGYYVEISVDGGETYTKAYVTSGRSYDVKHIGLGEFSVKITPYTKGYYTEPASAVTLNKTTLATPGKVQLSDRALVWNAIEGATGYVVTIDGVEYTTETNALPLSDEMLTDGVYTYAVQVKAVGETASVSSAFSAETIVHYGTIGALAYENGTLTWSPVIGAEGYKIRINKTVIGVGANVSSYKVLMDRAGINTFGVCFLSNEGDESEWTTIEVEAFAIELDTRGGTAVPSLYLAFGDDIVLPETARGGYTFAGWYDQPNAITGAGKPYTNMVCDGKSTILFANWVPETYTVGLDAGQGKLDVSTMDVVYGEMNVAPIPTIADASKIFAGWYSEVNGAGICYFDENGEATRAWTVIDEITLYAHFESVLAFKLTASGTGYSVTKGAKGLGALKVLTIPATYKPDDGVDENGAPVEYPELPVTVIDGLAFQSCTTLETINIPNTIEVIELGTLGIYQAPSAFQGCSKLGTINVYEVEGGVPGGYWSEDGVLYYNNAITGNVELKAYPYAKTGLFRIAKGVTTLPQYILRSAKVTELVIPYTVTAIEANAIYSCSSLTKVIFEDVPEGEVAATLKIANKAIYSCSKLTSIVLPARLQEFTVETIQTCSALTSIDVVGEGGNYTARGDAGRKVLCDATGTEILFCPKGMTGDFTIPVGITTIAPDAFASCTKIDNLTIPGHVTEIGKNAFKSCTGIDSITFEEGGAKLAIREGAFYGCSGLTSLTLPSGLYLMEQNAFGATSKLTEVTVNATGFAPIPVGDEPAGDPVVEYATNAFGTTATPPTFYVTKVNIGESVPTFDLAGVFGQKIASVTVDEKNPYYTAVDGVLFDKNIERILYYPTDRAGEYVLPETVKYIGARVFQTKNNLIKITIGKNVELIGEGAFQSSTGLTSIVFEEGGTADLVIEGSAFRSCSALTEINLPERTVSIGERAFQTCSKIVSITIPEGVTTIGDYAFSSCSKLESVYLPSTLEVLAPEHTYNGGFNVFYSSSALKTIVVTDTEENPNNYYTTIDNVLYKKSPVYGTAAEGEEPKVVGYVPSDLAYVPVKKAGSSIVEIPDTVTTLYKQAFYNNEIVTEIRFGELAEGKDLILGDQVFGMADLLSKITLPTGLKTIAKQMFYYCESLEEIVIPNTVTSIENQAFYYCTKLHTVQFAEGGTEPLVIEDATSYSYAPFYKCNKLETIVFPERMTELGDYAFAGYSGGDYGSASSPTAIKSVTFPGTLTRIGKNAFYYAQNLANVTFAPNTDLQDKSETALAIGDYAFYHTDALTELTLPAVPTTYVNAEGETVEREKYSIGNYVFGYSGIRSITFPANVKQLGNYVCYYMKSLDSAVFAEGCTPTIGSSLFYYSTIKNVTFPEGITEIGTYMFHGCKELAAITIPASVESIGNYAFNGCSALTTIVFETVTENGETYSKLASIGNYAFQNTPITSFAFPTLKGDGKLTLGTNLFSSCKSLETVTLSKSVDSIDAVFTNCYSIRAFIVDEENENFSTKAGNPILYNKDGTAYKYICGLLSGEHIIPAGVTTIEQNVFRGQTALTKVVIPSTVQKIGNYAFAGCSSLAEVIFEHTELKPSQLTADDSLGTYLFQNCTSLTSIALPSNIVEIPNYMFDGCTGLTVAPLHEGLTTIGTYAFRNTGLESVVIPSTLETIGNYAFAKTSAYKFVMPEDGIVTPADLKGFLTSVTFAKNAAGNTALTSLGTAAFQYQQIDSIVLPKTVTTIGSNAFSYNTLMKSFTFEEGTTIKTLGTYAWQYNSSLESFDVPETVTALGNYGFQYCTSLKSITFHGNKLKTLGTYTFRGCTALESITIPAGVTVLGTSATAATYSSAVHTFNGCTSLKSVVFEGKVTLIGGYVFTGCTALESITIPASVTQIGNYCFDGCSSLKSVVFEDGSKLKTIGSYVFRNCTSLESIELPDELTLIGAGTTSVTASTGSYLFNGCTALKSVKLPAKLQKMGAYVFDGCTALEEITIPDTCEIIGNYSFRNCVSLPSIHIPKSVKTFGTYVFRACSNLAQVTFEEGTTALTLGTYCFMETGLTSIEFPCRVTTLPTQVLKDCKQLTSITFAKNDIGKTTIATIGSQSFGGCSALTSFVIPESVTNIGGDAFLNCSGLTEMTIPKDVSVIGNNAFAGCHGITEFKIDPENKTFRAIDGMIVKAENNTIISIPNGKAGTLTVTVNMPLGSYALNGCSKIDTIVFEEGIEEIEEYALFGSYAKTVTLPSTLKVIGKGAFKGANIVTITIPKSVEELGQYAFQSCDKLVTVNFEEGTALKKIGTNTFDACTALTEITLPLHESMKWLGTSATAATYTFSGCTALTTATILGKPESIGGYVFQNCTALTTVNLPETITAYGTYLFSGCSALTEFTISDNITSIGNAVFQDTGLTSIHIPKNVEIIGMYAFRRCANLKSVTFAEGSELSSVGNYSFSETGIETIELPEKVVTLGTSASAYVFDKCENLHSVTFKGPLQTIRGYSFRNCTALESITIPSTVTEIASYAFQGSGLKSITIPASVQTIDTLAFSNCESLETVIFEEGCLTVGSNMFKGCTALKTVRLASTIETISANAFTDCTGLTEIVIPRSVTSIGLSAFANWTAEQTIKFECPESESATWTSTWADNCNAKIVWEYSPS